MMRKILITGISGFLGWNLFQRLRGSFPVVGTYSRHRPRLPEEAVRALDLRDPGAAETVCREISPSVIVHCAALTSPAACLRDPGLAREVNTGGTERIARAARRIGARLIYISTDRVFDGRKGDYREEDAPNPLGPYGQSKLAGEELVREILPGHPILRLPLMYGPPSPFSGSSLDFIFKGFRERSRINLFIDQFRTPLYVEDAGGGIELLLTKPELGETYHLGGGERINRAEFGYRTAEIFDYDPSVINPVRMSEMPHYPPSPPDASLNSDLFFRVTGFRGRGVNEGLLALKQAKAQFP